MIYVSLFLCQYNTVLIPVDLSHRLKSGTVVPPAFKIILVILSLLYFHKNFKIICSSSVKSAVGILIKDCIEYIDCVG